MDRKHTFSLNRKGGKQIDTIDIFEKENLLGYKKIA